ncbi:hypothetical protein ThvES_00005960 [Thiovulum sp. ES]|nr:hypothetical protein ThvES_00005960 [Thiovulum sp. ES]
MKNRTFLFLLFTNFLFSEEIYHKVGNKSVKYFKSGNSYSLYNENLETDGTILIRGKIENPTDFAQKYNLEFLKRNSTGTFLFLILSEDEIIEVCNKLQNLDDVETAEPNWKRKRGLK